MDHGRLRWAMNGETIIKTSRFSFNQRLIFQVHWKCFHWCPPPHPPNWCESIRVFPPNWCDLSVQGARADPGDNSRQPGRISHMHKNVQINYSSFSRARFFLFFFLYHFICICIVSYIYKIYSADRHHVHRQCGAHTVRTQFILRCLQHTFVNTR